MLEHLALIHLSMAFIENLSNLWNIRTHNIYILGYICPTISLSETTKPSRSDSSGDLEPLLEYRITPQDFDVINDFAYGRAESVGYETCYRTNGRCSFLFYYDIYHI